MAGGSSLEIVYNEERNKGWKEGSKKKNENYNLRDSALNTETSLAAACVGARTTLFFTRIFLFLDRPHGRTAQIHHRCPTR
jgi:hypothetical protein